MAVLISVLVQTPAHSGLGGALHYEHTQQLSVGTLVRVPLGQRETLGVVVPTEDAGNLPEGTQLRAITGVLEGLSPLQARWIELIEFAAHYYQRSPGEVALGLATRFARTRFHATRTSTQTAEHAVSATASRTQRRLDGCAP